MAGRQPQSEADAERRGVVEVTVMVTHGLFTGERWKELLPLIAGLYVTDSVPAVAAQPPEGVRVVSIRPLIQRAVESDYRRLPGSQRQVRAPGGTRAS